MKELAIFLTTPVSNNKSAVEATLMENKEKL
jgi:hypothetical protein